MIEYKTLPYDELKSLHKEIGAFIAEKKQEELEQLRIKMASLGFTPEDLAPRKSNGKAKYRNPETGETYGGKGPKPAWLSTALESGRQLEEFRVAS